MSPFIPLQTDDQELGLCQTKEEKDEGEGEGEDEGQEVVAGGAGLGDLTGEVNLSPGFSVCLDLHAFADHNICLDVNV
jgi:hypothetical protein